MTAAKCARDGCENPPASRKSKYCSRSCASFTKAAVQRAKRASGETVAYRAPKAVSVDGFKQRPPSVGWPERFERIRAKYGVKLPKEPNYFAERETI
jgi:hypothetical protein